MGPVHVTGPSVPPWPLTVPLAGPHCACLNYCSCSPSFSCTGLCACKNVGLGQTGPYIYIESMDGTHQLHSWVNRWDACCCRQGWYNRWKLAWICRENDFFKPSQKTVNSRDAQHASIGWAPLLYTTRPQLLTLERARILTLEIMLQSLVFFRRGVPPQAPNFTVLSWPQKSFLQMVCVNWRARSVVHIRRTPKNVCAFRWHNPTYPNLKMTRAVPEYTPNSDEAAKLTHKKASMQQGHDRMMPSMKMRKEQDQDR